jgi:Peptidase S46
MGRASTTLAAFLMCTTPLFADEGMWTFDDFPAEKVEAAYGFRPDQAWLDHLRLSSVRLARGCSAAFVSPHGLIQTNHHCAPGCISQLSTAKNDLLAKGFYAREQADETKCPDVEINQLIEIGDVTERIEKAIAGKEGRAFTEAMRAQRAAITRECSQGDDNIRCNVIDLYHGGLYKLYKYRRYQDVRLVFAPEEAIAFFGGDPDNFEFPRYDLDVAYLRVYRDGKPLDTGANFLPYAARDAEPGELTFTSGHPGSTHRLDTVADLEFRRDLTLPRGIFQRSELRGILSEFSREGSEQARIAKRMLFGIENTLKSSKGQFDALVDPTIISNRARSEQELRAKVDADPELRAQYGGAWDAIKTTLDAYRQKWNRLSYTGAFQSRLFGHALTLVRHATEKTKPDEARLPEYASANFPFTRQSETAKTPIYPSLEKLTLTFSLTKMREGLGPDDAFVKKVLGKKSPEQLATELVDGTGLADVELRKQLLEADEPTIAASTDPMIAFARAIDPELRATRKEYEDTVEAPLRKASTQLAQATFKLYGTSTYPDATFTLRLSYGAVGGYPQDGKEIAPITTIAGAFERATGADPFRLPDSWIAAREALNPRQYFNFVTTNDIVGGNSGSPVVNKAGEVVGLIFDGNIQSLGGTYGYDPAVNRAVAVDVGALREALAKVYHADRIVGELAN